MPFALIFDLFVIMKVVLKALSLVFYILPKCMVNFLLSSCNHSFSKCGEVIILGDCDISCLIYVYVCNIYFIY
jgi:hypothetical protein